MRWPLDKLGTALLYPLRLIPWRKLARAAAQAALRTELGRLVQRIVAEVEAQHSGASGPVKHSIAAGRIIQAAAVQGLPWRKWAVNILIELVIGLQKQRFDETEPRAQASGGGEAPPLPPLEGMAA
jgi:hypothetical protein